MTHAYDSRMTHCHAYISSMRQGCPWQGSAKVLYTGAAAWPRWQAQWLPCMRTSWIHVHGVDTSTGAAKVVHARMGSNGYLVAGDFRECACICIAFSTSCFCRLTLVQLRSVPCQRGRTNVHALTLPAVATDNFTSHSNFLLQPFSL